MFCCIYVKINCTRRLYGQSIKYVRFGVRIPATTEKNVKINCRSQKLQILVSSKINYIDKINSSLNYPNMIKSFYNLQNHF